MPGPGQLLGNGQAGRPGTDNGNGLAGQSIRGLGGDGSLVECPLDRGDLDLLDGHGGLVDTQHAGRLARRWAQPACELRKVVRGVQLLYGLTPVALPRQVVPLWNPVPQRATVVAERNTAVHAAAALPLHLSDVLVFIDLAPVHQPYRDRTAPGQLPLTGGQESPRISHVKPP